MAQDRISMTAKARFALVLLCIASAASGQSNDRAIRVTGHVYSSQSGRPLAGVVLTLELGGDTRNDRRQITSRDGSYAFDDVAPGGYTLTAFRRGLIGEIYGITTSVTDSTFDLSPGHSRDHIDFHLRTSPPIVEMPNEAMAAAYPQKPSYLAPVYGQFSPDGNLLAIATNGIVIGDAEQVWLYNRRTERLFAVTETPILKNAPMIRSIAWAGNTLYIEGERTQSTHHFVVKATADGAEEIVAMPLEAERVKTAPGSLEDANIGPYRVWVEKTCHGCSLDLITQALNSSGRKFTIARDMSAISRATFVFDPATPIVFYPDISWNGAIVAFNLKSRRSARLDLPIHGFTNLLAVRQEGNSFLLVYSVNSGSCTPKLSADGEDIWLLPNNQSVRQQQNLMSICFVRMHRSG